MNMTVINVLIVYLILVNIAGFASMGIDKNKARNHAYRIPEATLFLFAFMGGSFGSIVGMRLFHHKTRHWYFVYGMPAILIIELIFLLFVTTRMNISIM